MVKKIQKLVESRLFQTVIVIAIIVAAAIVGLETFPKVFIEYGLWLSTLDTVVLYVFAVEIILRIIAYGNRPWDYFRSLWNLFDFIIVSVCFLPLNSHFVGVLRLVRILRVLRMVTLLPRLQILVTALLRSIPSMGYVGILLFIHFYMYAVIGSFTFGADDPTHFGTLGSSLLTLFQVVTLEGWVEIMRPLMEAFPGLATPLYFVSFITIGGMIILNLFIGVIMNSMQESTAEIEARRLAKLNSSEAKGLTGEDFLRIENSISDLQKQLAVMRHRLDS